MWMIRTPGGRHAEEIIDRGIVGLGWQELGPLDAAKTPDEFYEAIKRGYPEYTAQQVINAGRQLYRFYREISIGDRVATYDSPTRTYHVGKVLSEVEYDGAAPEYMSNYRRVDWRYHVDRDALSQAARNSLGSTLTLFRPSAEAVEEIDRVIANPEAVPSLVETTTISDTEAEDPFANAETNSRELIKDRIMGLSWQDMQALVAGVLRAMGYKTTVSPEGGRPGQRHYRLSRWARVGAPTHLCRSQTSQIAEDGCPGGANIHRRQAPERSLSLRQHGRIQYGGKIRG